MKLSEDLTCAELVELVTDYLEGTLPRRDRRRMEKHLRACDGCTAYLESIRATIAIAGELPPGPVDPHVHDRLLEAFRDLRG